MEANPYAPPVETSDRPLQQRYPNPYAYADRGKVLGAGITLIVVGGLQMLVGLAILGLADAMLGRLPMPGVLGAIAAGQGVINVVLGIFTLRNSYGACVAGFILAIIGLAGAVLSFTPLSIIINGAITGLVGRGVGALRNLNMRIAADVQENPLVGYYHYFVPLLTRVMAADGHLDPRERQKIVQICDSMHISAYEQRRLIDRASGPQLFDAPGITRKYLEAARQIGLANPERQLLIAAVAVAGADGVLAAAEEKLIREMGQAMDVPAAEIGALIAQQQVVLDQLTPDLARQLLAVGPAEPPEQIKASYERLAADLKQANFSHLGATLGQVAERRRQILDRAYNLLQQQAA